MHCELINRMLHTPIRFDWLLRWNKAALSTALFHLAVALAFFGSLHPWFLWVPDAGVYVLIMLMMGASYYIDCTMQTQPKRNVAWLRLALPFALASVSMLYSGGGTFLGLLALLIRIAYVSLMFYHDGEAMRRAMDFVTRCMAVLLLVSMSGFALYLLGYPLPSSAVSYADKYDFYNYYLFLILDGDLWLFFPRFQSVFLEPSHLAVACVLLLMLQVGRWRRWYNVVLITATLISFSLEGYVLLVCLFFLGRWILRRHVVRGIALSIFVVGSVAVGSFYYHDGENILNRMIMQRLEVRDGNLVGNNRTTDSFDAEYESFLSTSDIWMGREALKDFGNAGYKVFIYTNGVVGLTLFLLFYAVVLYHPSHLRPVVTAATIAAIHFIVSSFLMKESCILPFYCMAWHYVLPDNQDATGVECQSVENKVQS